jgi:signal transduction histidine kinase
LLEGKRIELRKDLPDILLASIYPGDFLQLVTNLVRNSAEALPAGGVLCIRLRASGPKVRLTVADNGRGIPAPIQARLFEAFQSDKAEAGNGLGLWICKTIVDKHHGEIHWRSSTDGVLQGTTFSVLLPLRVPKDEEERAYVAG